MQESTSLSGRSVFFQSQSQSYHQIAAQRGKEIRVHDNAQCFIVVRHPESHSKYDIRLLLNGDKDELFKSVSLDKIYVTREDAVHLQYWLTKGFGNAYVLEMGYSPQEVKTLASQGAFSQAILRAIDVKILSHNDGQTMATALGKEDSIVNNDRFISPPYRNLKLRENHKLCK